jgi:hypothetical protein
MKDVLRPRATAAALTLLVACSTTAQTGDAGSPNGTAGTPSAGAGGSAGSAAGTTGTGGATPSPGGGGSGTVAMPPHYGDGGVQPVAATPPAAWVDVTANLAGMPSECGNTSYLGAHPSYDLLLTTVAQHGLWASTDGGTSWKQLWATAGVQQITNRGSSIVFDPAHVDSWWESGIYNGPGVYRTTDNGMTFTALGNAHHIDSVSVDLSDPQRRTLLAGGHEQKNTVYRSTDGGATWTNVGVSLPAGTNFCTNVLVIDNNTHLVGCSGYAGGTDGVFRTTDGGKTWAPATTASAASAPLWASDGTIYWTLIYDHGLIKSTDQGRTWTQTIQAGMLHTGRPIELPDGRIVAAGTKTLMVSSDKGVSFKPIGDTLPFAPNTIAYSPYRNAFFIEQFDCNNAVPANAISRFGFDYRTQ